MNVLITSASRKVNLVKSFKNALKSFGGKVIAVDINQNSPALYFADKHFIVPPSSNPNFLDTMLHLCKENEIKLLIPTRDEDLPLFAQNKESFANINTEIMVPELATINTCQDKILFAEFCTKHNFMIPETYDNKLITKDSAFPLFVRPRIGKGSKNIFQVNSFEEFKTIYKNMPDIITQEFIDEPEYTIDLFADFSGNIISAIPRERISVFGGESFVSKTVDYPQIIEESILLAQKLTLIGHNTIQCFYKNNKVRFIEVNPRFGGAAHLSFKAGASSCDYLVKILGGEKVEQQIGKYKKNFVMLRYTEDIFFSSDELENISK